MSRNVYSDIIFYIVELQNINTNQNDNENNTEKDQHSNVGTGDDKSDEAEPSNRKRGKFEILINYNN